MSQDALGQLKHLKTAKARWPFPDVLSTTDIVLDDDNAYMSSHLIQLLLNVVCMQRDTEDSLQYRSVPNTIDSPAGEIFIFSPFISEM